MPIFIEIGQLAVWFRLISEKLCLVLCGFTTHRVMWAKKLKFRYLALHFPFLNILS